MSTARKGMAIDSEEIAREIGDVWERWFSVGREGWFLDTHICEAIGEAWSKWLEANTDRLIAAIADRMVASRKEE